MQRVSEESGCHCRQVLIVQELVTHNAPFACNAPFCRGDFRNKIYYINYNYSTIMIRLWYVLNTDYLMRLKEFINA